VSRVFALAFWHRFCGIIGQKGPKNAKKRPKKGSSSYSSAGSGLVADSSGNLYGVAAWGGSFIVCKLGCGTVYGTTTLLE